MSARRTTLGAAAVLGLTLLAPTSAADASAVRCHGERATIVGSGGRDIVGTEGRDVVVTNRSSEVATLGGDDLVCITGPDKPRGTQALIDVDTGPGNDVVDGTGADDWAVSGSLGSGSDTFHGGDADDRIDAGERSADYSHLDSERDILSGGGGRDFFTTGQVGLPNGDYVRLGQGNDYVTWFGTATDPISISGGPGADLLSLSPTTPSIAIDNVAGHLIEGGRATLGWSDLEGFSVNPPEEEFLAVTFIGSDGSDHLTIDAVSTTLDASFGGGRDSLTTNALLLDGSTVDGGPGRDLLYVVDRDRIVGLDLGKGVLSSTDTVSHRAEVRRIEDAEVHARTVVLEGTDRPNDLSASACSAIIRGYGGADVLARSSDEWSESSLRCREEDYFLNGGAGPDVLRGWRGNDNLIGGPGRDRADGGKGRDFCRAEQKVACEL